MEGERSGDKTLGSPNRKCLAAFSQVLVQPIWGRKIPNLVPAQPDCVSQGAPLLQWPTGLVAVGGPAAQLLLPRRPWSTPAVRSFPCRTPECSSRWPRQGPRSCGCSGHLRRSQDRHPAGGGRGPGQHSAEPEAAARISAPLPGLQGSPGVQLQQMDRWTLGGSHPVMPTTPLDHVHYTKQSKPTMPTSKSCPLYPISQVPPTTSVSHAHITFSHAYCIQ